MTDVTGCLLEERLSSNRQQLDTGRAPYNEIGQSPARRRQPGWQQVDLPLNSSHPWLARPSCFGPVSASEHLETCMTWHETVNAHPDFRADIIRRDELRPRMMLALVRLLDPLFSTFSLSSACSLEALEPRGCDCHKEELCVNLASGTGNFKGVSRPCFEKRHIG